MSSPNEYFITPQLYGAAGDGHTDDTSAFQEAITAVSNAGGGKVYVPPKNYYFAGTLSLPANVSLQGLAVGPFDGVTSGNISSLGPVMLVTNTGTSFITITGSSASVSDLIFYYPNQVLPSSSAPIGYPSTISISQHGTGGHLLTRLTSINAFIFIDVQVGRVTITDCFIGAYARGINIDHAADVVFISRITFSVFWDFFENLQPPQTIDSWVLGNAYGLYVMRCDSLRVDSVLIFYRYAGILFTDSVDTSQNPSSGYGSLSNIDIDTCIYGVIAKSTNDAAYGYKITNLDIGAVNSSRSGDSAIILPTGGNDIPNLLIIGGSVRGVWAGGIVQVQVQQNKLVITDWRGYNI